MTILSHIAAICHILVDMSHIVTKCHIAVDKSHIAVIYHIAVDMLRIAAICLRAVDKLHIVAICHIAIDMSNRGKTCPYKMKKFFETNGASYKSYPTILLLVSCPTAYLIRKNAIVFKST